MSLGELVKEERERLGLSLDEFSRLAKITYKKLFEIERVNSVNLNSEHFQREIISPLAKIALLTRKPVEYFLQEEVNPIYNRIDNLGETEIDEKLKYLIEQIEERGDLFMGRTLNFFESYEAKRQLLRLCALQGYDI